MKKLFTASKAKVSSIIENATGQVVAIAGSAAAVFAPAASAAVPASVTTAITDMATDAAVVATAVLVAIIGVVAIKFIRKGL